MVGNMNQVRKKNLTENKTKSITEVKINLVTAELTANLTHPEANTHRKSHILKTIKSTIIINKTEKVATNIKVVKEDMKVAQTVATKKLANQNTKNTLVNILLNLNPKIQTAMLRIVATEA